MWHKAAWMEHPKRLEPIREGLLVSFANIYTTRGVLQTITTVLSVCLIDVALCQTFSVYIKTLRIAMEQRLSMKFILQTVLTRFLIHLSLYQTISLYIQMLYIVQIRDHYNCINWIPNSSVLVPDYLIIYTIQMSEGHIHLPLSAGRFNSPCRQSSANLTSNRFIGVLGMLLNCIL